MYVHVFATYMSITYEYCQILLNEHYNTALEHALDHLDNSHYAIMIKKMLVIVCTTDLCLQLLN